MTEVDWDAVDALVRRLDRGGFSDVHASGLGTRNVAIDFRVPTPRGVPGIERRDIASSLIVGPDAQPSTFVLRLPSANHEQVDIARVDRATQAAIDATAIPEQVEPLYGGAQHRTLPHIQTVSDEMDELTADEAVSALITMADTWVEEIRS